MAKPKFKSGMWVSYLGQKRWLIGFTTKGVAMLERDGGHIPSPVHVNLLAPWVEKKKK